MGETERDPGVEELRAWAERVATYFAQQNGLPPIAGRVIGWLLVCDPPEQSAAQLAEAVQASRASLTGTLRVLTASGFAETVTRPGARTVYYRVTPDAFAAVARRRLASMTTFLDITKQGLALLGEDSPRAARVRSVHELFSWLAAEVGPLWERWDARSRT